MSTYKDSGVDIDAGDRAVELMKASIARASRPEVMSSIGGFAGLFDASNYLLLPQTALAQKLRLLVLLVSTTLLAKILLPWLLMI